ncbi:hypothetical protein LEP1GSC151_1751 [Leptospira interrogans serovar Grippotyphosa str. LT2186]|uniref:Uncharacterized protein n=1 Tax=Leptospira interrogans serovar Grippotyphosa str. LT2186 TaxID=1001599 RepID=M3HFZ9_LEPIR|nr:hypothetical protein LEP1GSC151_1751 [Leptospira interrogans serovar Grippotyphosa str. LT2186]
MCVFNPSHSKILLTCGVGDALYGLLLQVVRRIVFYHKL